MLGILGAWRAHTLVENHQLVVIQDHLVKLLGTQASEKVSVPKSCVRSIPNIPELLIALLG